MSELSFRVSKTIESIREPPIPQAFKWAETYRPTPQRPLINMCQGVPGVPPPKELLDALAAASSSPQTAGYIHMTGEQKLKETMVDEMKHVYGEETDVTTHDISVTAGCNLAFAAAILAVAERGDEVILPMPWYFNHEMTLNMLGIKPVPLLTSSEDRFQPLINDCRKLITEATRAIVLVTPNNPTGAIYDSDLIGSFAALAYSHKLPLIIDETYRDLVTTGSPHGLFGPRPVSHPVPCMMYPGMPRPDPIPPPSWHWRKTVISLYSFSKAYCIPGHRLGLIVAPPALSPCLNIVLDNIQICAPRPPQIALASVLPSLRPFVKETALAIEARHKIFKENLPTRWKIGNQGAYYAFVRHPFKGVDAFDVCKRLAGERGLVVLPAGFFCSAKDGRVEGETGRWMRISVANVDDEKVRMACERLQESEAALGWELEE